MKRIFITGISTGVGKTLVAAIAAEALEADYWKPVQAGELENSDSHKVADLISNGKTEIHKSSYELKAPMSPHAAALLEGVTIDRSEIQEPETSDHLIIEGSGGLLVPLNDEDTILDIIMPNYKVIVVSRHYLGSINHTLLTVNWLTQKGYDVVILFNGPEDSATENIIAKKTGVPIIGRIDEETVVDKSVVRKYADRLKLALESL